MKPTTYQSAPACLEGAASPLLFDRHVPCFATWTALLFMMLTSLGLWGQTCTVTDNSDSPTDTGSLRYCINNATSGETINFSSALLGQTIILSSANGPLMISTNLTIQGLVSDPTSLSAAPVPLTISGGNAVQVFYINSGTVSISGLTITNGNGGNGGAIFNNGTLTVSNSTLSGNTATYGGGIYNNYPNGALTVSNSTFLGNTTVNGSGGGIYYTSYGNTLTVSNSTFAYNTAANSGGGILCGTPMTVSNSTFYGNTANYGGGGGGAIYMGPAYYGSAILTVSNSTISGNTASGYGGGIEYGYEGPFALTVSNSIVAGNTTKNQPGDDCDGCSGQSSYNLISTPTNIINPMLTPLGWYGGPTETMLPRLGSPALGAGQVTASDSLTTDQRGFLRNSTTGASIDAGAVQTNYLIVTTTTDTNDASPACDSKGDSPCSLRDAIAMANTGNNTQGTDITFASGVTGTINLSTVNSPLPTITGNLDLVGPGANLLTMSGGGSSSVGSIFNVNTAGYVAITSLTIANGYASGGTNGGAIYIYQGTLNVGDSTLVGNSGAFGGAIDSGYGTVTLTNSTLSGNSTYGGGNGGAISVYAGILAADSSTFTGNSATYGGAIYNSYGPATITNSTISGNTAMNGGGGIDINSPGTLTLLNDIVSGNMTTGDPGEDCRNCGTQSQYNLISTTSTSPAPMLAPLGNYGGSTQTMLPLPGSPAICAGSASLIPVGVTTDQRGFPNENTAYTGYSSSSPCVDVGAVQTNYESVQFTNAGSGYGGTVNQPISPAPVVSVTENSQNIGGVPMTLAFSGTGAASGLGPVTTVAGVGATFSSLSVNTAGSDTLSATLPIVGSFSLSTSAGLSIAANTVQVTVGTSPAGLAFTVDGTTYTSSQVLVWTVGTMHTIAVTSPQIPVLGTEYTFTQWSDGTTGLSDTVTASAGTTSYTASFSTSYLLTTAASPSGAGTASPATGSYYPFGAVVNLSATANAGYGFISWTGNVASASSASTTVTMIGPESVTANFEPTSCTVTDNSDNPADTGSLRYCIANTAPGGTITFAGSLKGQTITLNSANGPLTLNSSLTIQGPGANLLTISGGNAVQVFNIVAGYVNISGLTIANGNNSVVETPNTGGAGGGIFNAYGGTMTVSNSTVSGNTAAVGGGGILNNGTMTVSNSTISGNTAGGGGGGIENNGGPLTVSNSTISGNTAALGGGGIWENANTLTVSNSTISGNTAGGGGGIENNGTLTVSNSVVAGNTTTGEPGDDCDGCGAQIANNLINTTSNSPAINPMLAPLGWYGGPTQTMIPLPGSPAICAGSASLIAAGVTTDQRGYPNTNTTYTGYSSGSPCVDAGAVQSNYSLSFTTEPSPISPAIAILPNTNFQAAVTLDESGSAFSPAVTIPLALNGSGTLTGGSAATSGGTASYTTLQVNTAGAPDTLTANLALNTTPSVTISATSTSFTVGKATQTISFTQPTSPVTYGVSPITLSATATSGLTVTFSIDSSSTGTGTIGGNTLTVTGAGTLVIDANQAGNANYQAAAQVQGTIVVNPATPTISISNVPTSAVYGGSFTPTYSYSGNGSPTESVASSTTSVCTVSGGVVHFVGVGTCTLTASATATTDYTAVTGSPQSFTVGKATPTISISNIPTSAAYGGSFTPTYSYSGNGSPTESVASSTTSVCTVSGGVVHFVNVGTCTLTASATATTDYTAVTGSPQSFTVKL